jgi:septum formation topological specificity factor MinE
MNYKNYLKLLFVAIFSILLTHTFAQEKVIEKSKKKKPEWVNATIKDYIIVTGRGKTIDEAKNQVLPEIRTEIMNSVAIYVRSSSEITIENENKNNVINTIERFKNKSTLQTADIPALKGLSLNKAKTIIGKKLWIRKPKKLR